MDKRDSEQKKKLRFGREGAGGNLKGARGSVLCRLSELMFPTSIFRTFGLFSSDLRTLSQNSTVSFFKVTVRESFSHCEGSRLKLLSEKVPFRDVSAAI